MSDDVFVYLLKQLNKTLLVIVDDLQNLIVKIIFVVRGVDDFLALFIESVCNVFCYSIIKWISLSLKLFEQFFFASRLLDSPSLGSGCSGVKPKSLKNTSPSCTSS